MAHICSRCRINNVAENIVIGKCICAREPANSNTIRFIEKTYYRFLCRECLHEIENLTAKAEEEQFPEPGADLTPEIHYYMDQDLMVFTEYYHLLRGYCCGSGCRHCAYGYKK
jgi:hypothetical protein